MGMEEPTIHKSDQQPIVRLIEKLRAGDRSALARTITLVEQRAPDGIRLLKALFSITGHAQIIGITGAPGSGKSTLAGQIVRAYRAGMKTVGVIAVDPTSAYSGGATLGDRIRMRNWDEDPDVFIRSMASRGQMGGLASTTADVATVFDASGWDRILIETVGVGQDQLDVVSVADVVAVLMVPGMSVDVQAAKAGIVEAADIFVINKSNREGVEQIERVLCEAVSLNHRPDGWTVPIIKTNAITGDGAPELIEAVDAYFEFIEQHELRRRKAIARWQARLLRMLRDRVAELLLDQELGPLFQSYVTAVVEQKMDPYTAVEDLLRSAMEQPMEFPNNTKHRHGENR